MTEPATTALLGPYLARRDAHEAALTDAAWGALSPREQALVREAAVMGFVRGRMSSPDTTFPRDSAIVREVLGAIRTFPDLYPTLNALTEGVPALPGATDA